MSCPTRVLCDQHESKYNTSTDVGDIDINEAQGVHVSRRFRGESHHLSTDLVMQMFDDLNKNLDAIKQIVEFKLDSFARILEAGNKSQSAEVGGLRLSQEPGEGPQPGRPSQRAMSTRQSFSRSGFSGGDVTALEDPEEVASATAASGFTSLGTGRFDLCKVDDMPEPTKKLFQAVAASKMEEVKSLLVREADPNVVAAEFQVGAKTWKPCSLLAVAVLNHNVEMVQALILGGSHPDSVYGFPAGVQKRLWSGPISHATVPNDDVKMLASLLSSGANPHSVSSNGANLIWQCSYFGSLECLKHLLTFEVSHSSSAEHPDMVGVTYTPLHLAALRGHKAVTEKLLHAKANPNQQNELELTPLDDAIIQCRQDVVSLLVEKGAQLCGSYDLGSAPSLKRVKRRSSKSLHSLQRPIDRLFHLGNPIVIAGVARGLLKSDEIQYLRGSEVVAFLNTPGEAPQIIMKAIFRKRRVQYWQTAETAFLRKDITTAWIPDARVLPNGRVMDRMNVVVLGIAYSEIMQNLQSKTALDDQTLKGLHLLAPQSDQQGFMVEGHSMAIVNLFEAVVPDIHNDLRVIRAISNVHYSKLDHRPYQAILQVCWAKCYDQAVFEVIVHALLMVDFIAIGLIIQFECESSGDGQGAEDTTQFAKNVEYIPWVSAFGLLLSTIQLGFECLQCVAFHMQGWLTEYFGDVGNYFDLLLIAGNLITLTFLTVRGGVVAEYWSFRLVYSCLSFHKWIKILYALTPFRRFGPALLPILEAISTTRAFYIVLAFFILGMGHSYISLEPGRQHAFDAWFEIYQLSVLGASFADKFSGPKPMESYYLVRIFYMVAALLVSTTLMNVFIAALGNSFNSATDHMNELFEQRRADALVSHMAVRRGLIRIAPESWVKKKKSRGGKHVWFCCAAPEQTE